MAADTSFSVNIDTSAAQKSVESLTKKLETFGKSAGSAVSSATKSVSDGMGNMRDRVTALGDKMDSLNSKLNIGAAIAGTLVAINKLGDAFGATITKAREKEDALSAVRQAMARTGEFSEANAKKIQMFADRMEEATGLGDDMALKLFALAKGFGVSNAQAEKMVEAANQLSAATGKSLEASLESLGGTLTGSTGKLEKMIPALGGVSESALKAGAAIDIVMSAFAGTAEAKMLTFSGSLGKTSAAFEDLQVAMGEIFTKNTAVIEVIKTLGDVFKVLENVVKRNSESAKRFIGGFAVSLLEQIPDVLIAIDALTKGMGDLVSLDGKATGFFQNITTAVRMATDEILLLARGFQEMKLLAAAPFDTLWADTLDDLKKLRPELAGTINAIKEIDERRTKNALGGAPAAAVGSPAAIAEQAQVKSALEELADSIRAGAAKARSALNQGSMTPALPPPVNSPKAGPAAPAGPVSTASGFGGSLAVFDVIGNQFRNFVVSAGESFVKNIGGGEAGARKFVGELGSGMATMFGAAGPVAGGIGAAIELLGQDPETFGKMIDGFIDGIPRIIDNIIENIPTLVIAIAENSGEIITALVSASPRIVVALAQAMPVVAQALLSELVGGFEFQGSKFETALTNGANAIQSAGSAVGANIATWPDKLNASANAIRDKMESGAKIFLDAIMQVGKSFGDAVSGAFGGAVQAMIDAIKNALTFDGGSGSNNPFYSGSTKKGPVTGIPGSYLAKGGEFTVPGGFPNDSYPLHVQSGEKVKVTPANMMGNDDGGMSSALLVQILAALQQNQMANVGVSIDGNGIANAMVELSRRNARVG